MASSSLPISDLPSTVKPERGEDYLSHSRGVLSWIFTLDHKRIGLMYLSLIGISLLLGGLFALALRAHLWHGDGRVLSPEQYAQAFTLHGVVMIFLVIIPGVPAVLGNFVVPLMLGAKDVAFPRLNLASLWMFAAGVVMALIVLGTGGLDTGWTLYAPYSLRSHSNVMLVATAAFIMGFSSIFTGINMLVTIHTMRPPGMSAFRMPLFLWSMYATGIMQVLATPVLGVTLLLLFVERAAGVGIFDPRLGGDPVLFQHFFWFYSHPAVYIMVIPAFGVISEVISVHCRKRPFGYKFIALSSLAIALVSILVWGHHLYVSGQSILVSALFSALTFSVAVPSAIKVFNWLATMYRGSIALTTPMCWGLAFLFTFGIGGLTGLFCAALAVDVFLHDTYFIVAHFHFTMIATLFAFIAGIHHWWPKMFGRMYSERRGRVACGMLFIGMQLTFIPQFIAGSLGMPRRYWSYGEEFLTLHRVSTVGGFLMAAGFALMIGNLLVSLWSGRKVRMNPWGASTLEWACASPPPHDNFVGIPEVRGAYDYTDVHYDVELDDYVTEVGLQQRVARKP